MKDNKISDPFYLQIQREMNRIEKKVQIYNLGFYSIRLVQIILAGLITVLSGWHNQDELYPGVILILGAAITTITAFDTLFQIDTTRNTYKLVLFELRSIRTQIVYILMQAKTDGGIKQLDEKSRQQLFKKYQKANFYSRELIGSESDNQLPKVEAAVA